MKVANFIVILTIFSFLQSCVTSKPDSWSVSELDYNKRVSITGPYYKKKLSPVGITFTAASTIGGAYAGYNANAVTYYKGENKKNLPVADAIIGAAIGYSFAYIINRWAGNGKDKECTDSKSWLKKANKNFVYLYNNNSTIHAIHKSAETNYTVKNYKDFNDFVTAFPNSGSIDNIILSTSNNVVSREELKVIIQKYPNSPSILQLKKEFVKQSKTFIDLLDASEKYPETSLNIEELGYKLVVSISNLELFYRKFPNSVHLAILLEKVSPSASFSELESFISNNTGFPKIDIAKYWCIVKSPSITILKQKHDQYSDIISDVDAHEIAWISIGTDLTKAKEFIKVFPSNKYIKKYDNEDIYIGVIQNGKRDGYGFIIGRKNYTFKGTWKDDLKNGYGEEMISDIGYYYKGNFVNDNYEGHGEQKRGDADFYVGGFKNGERHGQGVLTFDTDGAGKATQKGNFVEGYMIGTGRIDFSNGEWYEGEFKGGLAHGYGEYRTKEGYRLTGKYELGLRVGKHSYRKFILGGLVDTEKGEIDFGTGEGIPQVTETYNVFTERVKERRESDSNCIEEIKESENYDDLKFKFSGREYTPASSNWVYEITCQNGTEGWLVFLSYDTYAEEWYNSNWEKGWYYYQSDWLSNSKFGPYKTLEEAKKETCDCN